MICVEDIVIALAHYLKNGLESILESIAILRSSSRWGEAPATRWVIEAQPLIPTINALTLKQTSNSGKFPNCAIPSGSEVRNYDFARRAHLRSSQRHRLYLFHRATVIFKHHLVWADGWLMAAERMRPWGRCKNINWLTFASRRQFDFWFLPKLVIGRFDQLAQALQQSSSKTVSTSEIFSVLDNPELLIWYYIENQFWPADCTLTWGGWLEWWTSSVFIRFWFLRYFAHLIREPVSLAKRSDWAEFPANLIFLRRTRQVFNIS